VSARFEELDRQSTVIGEISLRRRWEPSLHVDVYEARLEDEFLMSSLFTTTEVALATLGLAQVAGESLDVVVGGLGLGYTANAVLADPRVRSVRVVDALGEVVGWHKRSLLPVSGALLSDPRCELFQGDFFAMVEAGARLAAGGGRCHALLVDIDHSPRRHLHPSHAPFYAAAGLSRVAAQIHPGGVFALWSDDLPDAAFAAVLDDVFASSDAHVVSFANPYTGGESSATIYVASVTIGSSRHSGFSRTR
jgi:hypothetical protein